MFASDVKATEYLNIFYKAEAENSSILDIVCFLNWSYSATYGDTVQPLCTAQNKQ